MADIDNRLAAAPISWGVCEVPGWGHQLEPERVFGEMASLGIKATELGPIGYLPFEPAAIREALDRHGLRLVGGFVPLVLHEPTLDTAEAERVAAVLAAAGAEVFNAAVVADAGWSPPLPLDDDAWKRLARHLGRGGAPRRAARPHARAAPARRHAGRDGGRRRADAGAERGRLVPGHRAPADRRRRPGRVRPRATATGSSTST